MNVDSCKKINGEVLKEWMICGGSTPRKSYYSKECFLQQNQVIVVPEEAVSLVNAAYTS